MHRQEYVCRLIDAYRKTPGTTGLAHRQDRRFAEQLYAQQIPLTVAENALLLASARRLFRPNDAPPLETIRSLHYFRDVMDEVMKSTMSEEYFIYLRRKLAALQNT